jgi:hypothetical protein
MFDTIQEAAAKPKAPVTKLAVPYPLSQFKPAPARQSGG